MTIWNCIRDWFVHYVFGGFDSVGTSYGSNSIGKFYSLDGGVSTEYIFTNTFFVSIGGWSEDIEASNLLLSFGDWLSTTATIITLCLLVFMLYLFARWIFKQVAGLMSF